MIKNLFFFIFISCMFPAYADFNLPGKGELIYPTGLTKTFQFGFAWNEQTKTFTIGNKSYNIDELPDSYSVALAINKDEKTVWIQEFTKGYFEQFNWEIDKHHITLKKEKFANPTLGNYVLIVDGAQYFFVKRAASINFKFNAQGIESISIDGVTKDFGTKG